MLEFLPMPTTLHQKILMMLVRLLDAHLHGTDALILPAPLHLKVGPGKFRDPDLLCVLNEKDKRVGEKFWAGADLVMEVVSPGKASRERDYDEKPPLYAKVGVSEYWIVDPVQRRITVKALRGKKYVDHSVASNGQVAASALLPGFTLATDRVFGLA